MGGILQQLNGFSGWKAWTQGPPMSSYNMPMRTFSMQPSDPLVSTLAVNTTRFHLHFLLLIPSLACLVWCCVVLCCVVLCCVVLCCVVLCCVVLCCVVLCLVQTHVGEHLLTLVQQLEPYVQQADSSSSSIDKEQKKTDSENWEGLLSPQPSPGSTSRRPTPRMEGPAVWLDRVASGAVQLLVQGVEEIKSYSETGRLVGNSVCTDYTLAVLLLFAGLCWLCSVWYCTASSCVPTWTTL